MSKKQGVNSKNFQELRDNGLSNKMCSVVLDYKQNDLKTHEPILI